MMPQLGETVTEGTITRWMKGVGDSVERDEPLFEVSTDKVDSEVPSPAAGVINEILVPEGETVEVGVKLAVIGDGGSTAPSDALDLRRGRWTGISGGGGGGTRPRARTGSGVRSGRAAPPQPAPAPTSEPVPGNDGAGPHVLSPMVRKLLAENGISESEVTGTGSGGRITRDDALRVVDARRSVAAPTSSGARLVSAARRRSASRRGVRARDTCCPRTTGLHGIVPCRR